MNLQQRRVVVDTSVISHIFRQDEIGVQYRELLVGQQTLISFQTLAERAYSANWGQRRIEEFRSYLERYTVIWPDDDLVETYARVVADCSRTGWTIESADAWIAARRSIWTVRLLPPTQIFPESRDWHYFSPTSRRGSLFQTWSKIGYGHNITGGQRTHRRSGNPGGLGPTAPRFRLIHGVRAWSIPLHPPQLHGRRRRIPPIHREQRRPSTPGRHP